MDEFFKSFKDFKQSITFFVPIKLSGKSSTLSPINEALAAKCIIIFGSKL